MTDTYTALIQQILNISQRERKPNILITTRRMISGDVLKYLKGFLLAVPEIMNRNQNRKVALIGPASDLVDKLH